MREDARDIGELGLGLVDRLADRKQGGLAIERADLVAALLLPLRNLVNDMLKILFQHADHRLDLVPLGLGPGAELLGRNHLAVDGRAPTRSRTACAG